MDNSLLLMLPELIVVGAAFAVLILDLFTTESRKQILAPVAAVALTVALVVTVLVIPREGACFGGRFALDAVGWWFKLIFLLSGLITVALSADMLDGRVRVRVPGLGFRGEFYTVLLFTVAGMMYLVSARELITLYVALELTTVPLFVLAAWRRDRLSGEAGLKYVVLGALSSALLLYGLSLLFGLTGTTRLTEMALALGDGPPPPVFWLAGALVLAGVGFKLTLVPFHLWAADVYQGAPTPITAYLSVASKGAGLAFMFQLFYRVLSPYLVEAGPVIAILAALTMTWGNVVAIQQNNIKRFMAFSAISQGGVLIMGFLGASPEGPPAMLFYMLVYTVSNLAVFGGIIAHANATGRELIADYRGLSRTNPMLSLGMMLALFSLAGIPPLAGFVGKWFLFSVASGAGYHWLVAVAAVNSCISLYYYLRVVREMYIEPLPAGNERLPVSPILGTVVAVTALGAVLLGLIPYFYETIHAHTLGWLG